MKKTMLSILLAVAALSVMADNLRHVGYAVTDDIDVNGACFGQAGTYTVGAYMPASLLAAYEGCRVLGVRYAVSESIGRTRAFMYDVSDTGVLTEISAQKQRTYEGWNTVTFNGDGYVITGNENIFFGYDYVETDEMVAEERGALCGTGNETDGAFMLYGNYGQGEGLYSISGIGCLCVQLIIDVSSLPTKDIDMNYIDAGHKYKTAGSKIELFTMFSNVGRDTIFSYRMGYQIDDREPVYEEFNDTLLCGEQESWEPVIMLSDDIPVGMHTLKAFVSQIEGMPVEKLKNDTIQATFALYRDAFSRHQVYVEVYAHQQSPYVPMLDKALNMLTKDNPQVALVNTFAYGNPLFVEASDYLHQLYAYTYPTFTFNRAYFPGENYIAYDMNDYLPQVPASFIAGILTDMYAQDFLNPAFATVELEPQYDTDSRQLSLSVSGQTLPEAEAIYGDIALTVLLTEDGVTSPQSVYNELTQRTTTQNNYVHDHVLRQYVTAPIGDPLTLDDGTYHASYSVTIPEGWNPENMRVVAFITKAADAETDDNVMDMDITNANSCAIPVEESTAIRQLTGETTAQHPQAYTIDGQPIAHPTHHHGIAILRMPDGKSRKVVLP